MYASITVTAGLNNPVYMVVRGLGLQWVLQYDVTEKKLYFSI